MQIRPILLSALAGGIVLGALASQAVPVDPRAAEEPAWRSLVQPQYQSAYTPAAYGGGPEDATPSALVAIGYNPYGDERGGYALPPEYAAAERQAREAARAAADAERQYRAAYTEATRPIEAVTVTRGNDEEAGDALAAQPKPDQEDAQAAPQPAPEAKVITVAAVAAN